VRISFMDSLSLQSSPILCCVAPLGYRGRRRRVRNAFILKPGIRGTAKHGIGLHRRRIPLITF